VEADEVTARIAQLSRNRAVFTDSSRPLRAQDHCYLPRIEPGEVMVMRRYGKPIAAAGAAVALGLGPATMGAAASASPLGISHGCPGSHVCLYGSQSAFSKGKPTVTDAHVPGLHSGGVVHLAAVVNNTLKYYASEGIFETHYLKYQKLCEYVPDPKDEQDPNRIEDPADGADIDAIASGSRAVDAPFYVSLRYCPPA
jgi:hypothetical protein